MSYTRIIPSAAVVATLLVAGTARAVPVTVTFNTPGFGPAPDTVQTFQKNDVTPSGVDLTFAALNQSFNPSGHLYWDSDDGFGVMSTGDALSYSADEIEGNERLRLSFSAPVQLVNFGVTDLFYEDQDFSRTFAQRQCTFAGKEGCYRERGQYQLTFADSSTTGWLDFVAPYDNLESPTTNGAALINVGLSDVIGINFRAPGMLNIEGFPYTQLHEFSVASVTVNDVPEPVTVVLLGAGLLAGMGCRRRVPAA